MEASLASPSALIPSLLPRAEGKKPFEPNNEAIKQRLLRKGVFPTPKILHAIRKKEIQKALRRAKKEALNDESLPLSVSQRQALEEDAHFRTVSAEYRAVREELRRRNEKALALAGKPWERLDKVDLRGLMSLKEECGEGRLKGEHLEELRKMLAERNGERFRWLLDDDVEEVGGVVEEQERKLVPSKQNLGDEQKIQLLIKRLSSTELNMHDWKFPKLMKQLGLFFTEMYLLKILEGLGDLGKWRQALSVVEWVYNQKHYKHRKSRFVYTKLLAVLGKARRPSEALRVFNGMRVMKFASLLQQFTAGSSIFASDLGPKDGEDGQIYPDMAAYHTIAVTLGQAGLLNELMTIIERMRQKPSVRIKNMKRRNWDPCLEPDIVIYNAVLNACIPSHQWKGVFWVLEQIRLSGLKPTGATYGLAMEVMLRAGKHDFVHNFFEKMQKSGLPPKALTYKVLVRSLWEEGKVDEAVEAVRDMEKRGVVGQASVYYELACCLCNNGRWKDAMMEVEKMKSLPLTKPLEVAFTGMILSSLDGGYIYDCISIFEHMKDHCDPNIGTINAMLKVYGHSDMFTKAKELFESYTGNDSSLEPDAYSYSSMLEISASAHQWEYFEYVYKEMALCGYQLDQRKHSWFLVEASRAGKLHLLEHAFDTVLEAGEIPHVSLFTEMICQTIAEQNFKRAVSLINGMAHASLKVGEIQWLNLFQINMDRFSKDKLHDLLNHISGCDLVMEDPVPNFLKALQSFCGKKLLKDTTVLTETSDVSAANPTVNGNERGDNSCDETQVYIPGKMLMDDDGSPLCSQEDSIVLERHLDRTEGSSSIIVCSQERVNNVASSSFAENEGNELHSVFHGYSETPITDAALDSLTTHTGRPFSESPSALQILETWKQDRIRDGIFPFQC